MVERSSVSNKSTAGVAAATSLVVANMIGTGVFISLGFQLLDFHSAPPILFLWVLGGVVALCGALCYAEIARRLPRSGGEYTFLGRIYHPSLGFMAGMLSAVAGFAVPTAITALALGEYLHGAVEAIPVKATATLVILIGTAAHGLSSRTSARVQIAATSLKLLLIFGFLIAVMIFPGKGDIRWHFDAAEDLPQVASKQFASAFFFVLYAYSGWNAAVYGLEEWRNQGSTVKRALLTGTALVMVLYVGLNVAFLMASPAGELRGATHIGQVAARSLFGDRVGHVASGLFALGLFSSVSALLWAGPRVLAAMGRDMRILSFFAPSEGRVPVRSLLFQTVVALAMVLLVGKVEVLLDYTQTALTLCTFLTVFGMFILRKRDLTGPRGSVINLVAALIFLGVTGFVMVRLFMTGAASSAIGLGTALAFALLWFPLKRFSRS
jgi:APA family basic amino acid/polyamine antiporter